MNRTIGRNTLVLVKLAENPDTLIGPVVAAIKFVDDYRPVLNIDRRYAEVNYMGGCIWYSDHKNFNTKDEGNDFFKQMKSEGYTVGTEQQFNEFIRRAGDLTY